MNPLDVPFGQLVFPLPPCKGRLYTVAVEQFCSRPLHAGLLEHSYQDPTDDPIVEDLLLEMWQEELDQIQDLKERLAAMWGAREWTVVTPPPEVAAAEFQRGERLFGRLCAAVLRSWDGLFPSLYRGEDGERPADYSEAFVIYATDRSEGLFPERVRSLIAWEDVAPARVV